MTKQGDAEKRTKDFIRERRGTDLTIEQQAKEFNKQQLKDLLSRLPETDQRNFAKWYPKPIGELPPGTILDLIRLCERTLEKQEKEQG